MNPVQNLICLQLLHGLLFCLVGYNTTLIKCFWSFCSKHLKLKTLITQSNFNFPWQFKLPGFNCIIKYCTIAITPTLQAVAVSGFATIPGALKTIPVKNSGLFIAASTEMVPPCNAQQIICTSIYNR